MNNIRKPFISDWHQLSVNDLSPLPIPHSLNELPAKVDVQVKITHSGKEYIFPGLGSVPKDDDIPTEYGGVAYAYNSSHVLLFVPVIKSSFGGGIGRVITTGSDSYNGPFVGSASTCKVRIRAWGLSDWPKPDFSITAGLTISTASPYKKVHHCLGTYPDFVTVQLLMPGGLVSEGLNDYVSCFRDGWGDFPEIVADTADVIIRAWMLSSSDILNTNNFSYVKGDAVPWAGVISMTNAIDLDFHIVNVEIKDTTVSKGKVFYGAGSANMGYSGESYGGVVFGFTQSDVLLWTPSTSVVGGNLIYIGGLWGDGTENMQINNVQITVKVIKAGFTEWPLPQDIPNTIKLYNGVIAGSKTLYACTPGFSSNGGSVESSCNGTSWSDTTVACSAATDCPSVMPSTAQSQSTVPPDTKLSTVTPDTNSIKEFDTIIAELKVPKVNTSAFRRSLTCAYDSRESSMAIGSSGVSVESYLRGRVCGNSELNHSLGSE
ncbi:uncharacterized protein LOC134272334 [Saccostrea cucullata]|uniref:uncharacterized protein LOC134272334 n=1 Tax=Saccostrea cuccullata TaxID=36930 RepID=UPI002ED20C1D